MRYIGSADLEVRSSARNLPPAHTGGGTAFGAASLMSGAPSTAGRLRALAPHVGNRVLARHLARQPKTEEPSATQQTTWQNRDLAKRIDQLRTLDNAGLAQARKGLTQGPTMSDPATQAARYDQQLRAIEWVSSERGLPVVPPSPGDDDAMHLERLAAKNGSLKETMNALLSLSPDLVKNPQWIRHREAVEHRADQFTAEFESQARQNAEALLKDSLVSIKKVLESYGLPAEHVVREAGEHSTGDVVASTMRLAHLGDFDTTYKRKADKRMRFAAAVLDVKAKQGAAGRLRAQVEFLESQIQHPENISPQSDESPASLKAKVAQLRPQMVEAEKDLATTWIEAERQDEVFAAYRTGEELDTLSFGDLEHMIDLGRGDDGDANMRAVLGELVPKVANIKEAWPWIHQKKVSPLTLPPVVELTRRYMFVAPGSFTAAVLKDAVEKASSNGVVRWVIEALLLALALITAVPTGGASLALPAAAAGVMYGVYSAMDEYVKYGREHAFGNTAIDRARSLTDQEPSLTGFVIALIGAGLDAIPLAHAFSEAVALRRLALAGEEATVAVAKLNKLGQDHNLGNIGSEVEEAAKAERAAGKGAAPKATEPHAPEAPKAPEKPAGGAGGHAADEVEREVAGGARIRTRPGGRRTLCINPCAELDHLSLPDEEIDAALRHLKTVPHVDTKDFVETLAAFKGADDIPVIEAMVKSLAGGDKIAAASAADLLERITHLRQIEGYQFKLSELAAAHSRGDAILAHGPLQTPEFLEDVEWGGSAVGEWRMDGGQLSFPKRLPLSQHRLPARLETLDFVIVENERGSGLRMILGKNHSGLSGGKPFVFAAGELKFSPTGELVSITRLSGHYRPAVDNLERARQFLRDHNMLSPRGVALVDAVP